MSRLRRLLMGVLAGSLALGTVLLAPPAAADPTTVAEAQAALDEAQEAAAAAEQAYDEAHANLEAIQQEIAELEADLAAGQAAIDALRDEVASIALTQYQNQGVSNTLVLLTSGDSEDLIYQWMTTQRLTTVNNDTITQFAVALADQADQRDRLDFLQAEAQAEDERLAQVKEEAEARMSAAQSALAALQAAQRRANQTTTGGYGTSVAPSYTGDGSAASIVVAYALSKVGGPYVYGGNGPVGYDCSGLVRDAYLQVGIALPHSSSAQFAYGTPVSLDALQPGDILFYYAGISHVAIYIGDGLMVHASTWGIGIVVQSAFYSPPVGARRLV